MRNEDCLAHTILTAAIVLLHGISANAQIRDLVQGDSFSRPVGQLSTIQEESVNKLNALSVMVKILGPSAQGSGVLVRLPDGNIGVITARHVVASLAEDESIDIVLTRGQVVRRSVNDIRSLKGLDIAVIVLPSDIEIKRVASFSARLPARGDEIFAAGFPITSEGTDQTNDFRTYSGLIQTSNRDSGSSGFHLGYSSKTYIGMSGGAIFSLEGRLVGIHGRGEALSSTDVNKSGTNWGIPITVILESYRANLTSGITGKIEDTPRYLLSRDYKSALATWRSVFKRHPDSAIAAHNVECLESIVNKRSYSPKRWKFDRRESGRRKYELAYGLEVYWSDPLVRSIVRNVSNRYYAQDKEWLIHSYGNDIKRELRWADPYTNDVDMQPWHPYPENAKTELVELFHSRDSRFYKGCSVLIRAFNRHIGATERGYKWADDHLAPFGFDDQVLVLGDRYLDEWKAARKKDRVQYHVRVLLPPD